MHRTQALLTLNYAESADAALAQPGQLLGLVGYGAERPSSLPTPIPFITIPLLPVSGCPAYEIWHGNTPAQPCQSGPVTGACNNALAFGYITLAETAETVLEDVTEQAYLAIFQFLEDTGCTAPIRFWNYLTAITAEAHGLERYRRFNIGRHRAFTAKLRQPVPPVASCLGAHRGPSSIYFLAAREAATPIENPRQISAYDYPPLYGPRSPSFSRASLYGKTLLISGTASIVGHETRHPGDLPRQIAETIQNLQILIAQADAPRDEPAGWAFKVYLRDPAYYDEVETALCAAFGAASQRLYLHADICRPDLLIEIEALRQ